MLDQFKEVWLHDFEFYAPDGERPQVIALGAKELRSGRIIGISEFGPEPPYDTGPDNLFVSYYSSAEVGCHLALGWPAPANVLDLFVEFRNLTNASNPNKKDDSAPRQGRSLLAAMAYHGLDAMAATEKDDLRSIAMRGPPWDDEERQALVAYALEDVRALEHLLPRMLPKISLGHALLRGKYMAAAAVMERNGTPVDVELLHLLRGRWEDIKVDLVADVDRAFGVYEGTTFKRDRFEAMLAARGIPWPRLASGQLDLEDGTFRNQAKAYPVISPLRELRSSLSKLKLNKLAVGSDGRNRCMLSAFNTVTGRNSPGSAKFIFGPHVWLRGLIRPEPGHAIAYLDYAQQEFGIAAALSGDREMLAAYESGDPYLSFAKRIGMVPADATKKSHEAQRELAKQCILATQYLMGYRALAAKVGESPAKGAELLRLHGETYRTFWKWSQAAVDHAMLTNTLHTVLGWRVNVVADPNPRSLANFLMQGNGSEILRLACCLGLARGVEICCPVHDAVLISAPASEIEDAVLTMQAAMTEASAEVLGGFRLGADKKVILHPDRYMDDKRGREMWDRVMNLANPVLGCAYSTTHVAVSAQGGVRTALHM
jgi:DNA polymerase-1